jgi:hypothetical protein
LAAKVTLAIPPGGKHLYVSAAFGSVLKYELATLKLVGQVIVTVGLPMPPMSVNF